MTSHKHCSISSHRKLSFNMKQALLPHKVHSGICNWNIRFLHALCGDVYCTRWSEIKLGQQASIWMNQCWFFDNWTLRNEFRWDLNQCTTLFIRKNVSQNIFCKVTAIWSWPQWVKEAIEWIFSTVINPLLADEPWSKYCLKISFLKKTFKDNYSFQINVPTGIRYYLNMSHRVRFIIYLVST